MTKYCVSCGKEFASSDWRCPGCGRMPDSQGDFLAFSPELAQQNDGFNPAFFHLMTEVEPVHFWFVSRNRLLQDVLVKDFHLPDKIFEIGCGTGFVLSAIRNLFPNAELSASDIYVESLAYAAHRVPEAFIFQMDARKIPFHDEFDLIGAFDVLEHIEKDEDVLVQMYHACRPGGGIVATVPQHRWLWSRVDDFAHHRRRYTRDELVRKFQSAGFRVEYVTSFVSLLLPLMLIARLFRRHSGTEMDAQMDAAGLRIGKATNMTLMWVMTLERFMIRWGVRFPIGGSLMVIARKPCAAKNG